jgi:hypothetical protein
MTSLQFTLRRSEDIVGVTEITSTRETVHGLMRVEGENLIIQWRVARSTDRVGMVIKTEREMEPVREVVVPLAALASARFGWRWRWPPGRRFILTASDLRAFEPLSTAGFELDNPTELAVGIRRPDRLAAREFAGDLDLALAERAVAAAEQRPELPPHP